MQVTAFGLLRDECIVAIGESLKTRTICLERTNTFVVLFIIDQTTKVVESFESAISE